jgi:uncharacterized protein
MAKTPGLGILLPANRGSTGYFRQGFDALTQTKSNLTNLILTKKGERVMQPEFGCRVHEFLFENITDELISNVRGSIEEAVQIWLPFVVIKDVKVKKDDNKNVIFVEVSFSLKANERITDVVTLIL